MTPEALRDLVVDALEDRKGRDIATLDVRDATNITDYMLIVSGTSSRHVKALVDEVTKVASEAGNRPRGVEGQQACEWVLVDLGDVIVHVMQGATREFYDLERLWTDLPVDSEHGV